MSIKWSIQSNSLHQFADFQTLIVIGHFKEYQAIIIYNNSAVYLTELAIYRSRFSMGVKGFLHVIDSNLSSVCGPLSNVEGRLVIDGINLLHELYVQHHLDWANGGCYAKLREVTLELFGNFLSAGVRPIIVLNGAGVQSQLEETVYRRNRSIGDIPESIKKAHTAPEGGLETRHFLPILAHPTFVNALKEIRDVTLICADGKANKTVVQLANHYGCSVLVNDTSYCVFDVQGGIIFYKYLKVGPGTCKAYVVNRDRLFRSHFKLNDLSLVFAMVAILGDGSDASVQGLYYGKSALKQTIDRTPGVEGGRNWPLSVAQFLRSFRNFEQFKHEISTIRVYARVKSQLNDNCQKAEKLYTTTSTISCESVCDTTMIMCSYPCDVPSPLLRQFRDGSLPNFLMNAIALGQNCLCQQIGDVHQQAVVMLGRPIRAAAYGFASGLMDPCKSDSIREHHRCNVDAHLQLNYSAHIVHPTCKMRELMVTNIAQLNKESRISLAKQAILTILECNWDKVSTFDNDSERSWMLVVALTHFWANHQLRGRCLPNPERIVRSMVYSFVTCSSGVHGENQKQQEPLPNTFRDPNWIKAYHAGLEWQSLYRDTVGLNAILMKPFDMLSPACLYNGKVVIHYAIRSGLESHVQRLPPKEKVLYDKLLSAVMDSV